MGGTPTLLESQTPALDLRRDLRDELVQRFRAKVVLVVAAVRGEAHYGVGEF